MSCHFSLVNVVNFLGPILHRAQKLTSSNSVQIIVTFVLLMPVDLCYSNFSNQKKNSHFTYCPLNFKEIFPMSAMVYAIFLSLFGQREKEKQIDRQRIVHHDCFAYSKSNKEKWWILKFKWSKVSQCVKGLKPLHFNLKIILNLQVA